MPGESLPRACRLKVDPHPLLVLEVPAESTWRSDLGPKLDADAAMDIVTGCTTRKAMRRPRTRTAFRYGAGDWTIREAMSASHNSRGMGKWPVYHSTVLRAAARDMNIGLPDETGSRHWLQWRDPDQGLWRDREVDAERKT